MPLRHALNWYYERHPVGSFYNNVDKLPTDVLPPPIIVLAVKGGIGKTLTVSNTALKLAQLTGSKVMVWDVDIENPSIVRYLGMTSERTQIDMETGKLLPVRFTNNGVSINIHSMGTFLMDNPRRVAYFDGKAIQEQLIDALFCVDWGNPDYLLIDAPPTLSDEFIVIRNVFNSIGGAIVVGTSEQQAVDGCERSINMCIQHGIPIIGIVENKSGAETSCCKARFICEKCGEPQELYDRGGIRDLAERYNKPFLGTIPFNPIINKNRDNGKHLIYNEYEVFENVAKAIIGGRHRGGYR